MADEEANAQERARTAIYEAIAQQVASLRQAQGQTGAAEALKNLAEAYAWVSSTAQSH
jgi:hypothetical protein